MKEQCARQRAVALLVTLALLFACGAAPAACAASSPGFYTIYLETQGGTGTATQTYARKGTWTGYRISSFPIPTMEGYKFEGWYDDAVGGEEVDGEYEFTGDTTIYAHWVPEGAAAKTSETDAAAQTSAAGTGFSIKNHLGTVIVVIGLSLVALSVAAANAS